MKYLQKLIVLVLIPVYIGANPDERDVEQEKRGNFLLPTSQQPSPFDSIGQDIVDKGDILGYISISPFGGNRIHSVSVTSYLLYGVTDTMAVILGLPYAFASENSMSTSGLGDMSVKAEYAFYEYNEPTFTKQATVVASITVPTGKDLSVNTGSLAFLFGGCLSYYSPDWFWVLGLGGTIATKHDHVRPGSNVIYQAAFGKNLGTRPGWIFTGIVEFNGLYTTRSSIHGETDRNSGSNVLSFYPSLWISSERLIIQGGPTFIPVQHVFGNQRKYEIGGLISLGCKFN